MSASTNAVTTGDAPAAAFDFKSVFHAHYRRITRVIFRVLRDPSRAEELAVDVFCRLWRHPSVHAADCGGWLYRTAVHIALDELRKRTRREKYERWFGIRPTVDDQRDFASVTDQRTKVRTVLAALRTQDAKLVALRAEGLSYDELARALNLKPTSIGTLLRRAQESFRKEYVKRYGDA